jgi:PAS domain S-box-containing protein
VELPAPSFDPAAIDVIDALPVAVVVVSSAGRIQKVNSAAAALLGRAPADLVDQPASALERGSRHGSGDEGSPRLLQDKRPLPDGRSVIVLREGAATQEAALESEQELRFVVDAVPALLAFVDTDARYVWANESYRRWFGQSPESIRGRHVREVLGETAWEQIRPRIDRVLAGEAVRFDNRAIYRHGPARYVDVTYLPHRDASGRVRGVVVMVSDVSKAKDDETALRDSQRMLADSQTAAHVGSWESTLAESSSGNAGVLRWSDEAYRIFGFEPGRPEATYARFLAVVHPDDREGLGAATAAGVARGGRFEKEYRIVRADGAERVIHVWASVEKDPAGGPTRLIGTCQDVTEQKRAEREIRQAREQLQLAVDSTPALIARYDHLSRLVWANKSYAARYGTTPERLAGRPLREIVGDEAFPVLAAYCERVLAGETIEIETEVPAPGDGGPRYIQLMASPTLAASGAPDGCVVVITDLTHRRELENALRLSEERYRSLVGATTSVVWTTNAAGEFVEPQAPWEAYTGQSWQEHRGRGWLAALHQDCRDRIERLIEGPPVQDFDQSACRVWHAPTATFRICERTAVAIRNPDGSLREWIGTLVDVHERERALLELKAADRRKDEFLAMLSHELRNPLAPILSAVEILRLADQRDAELSAKYQTVIERQVQHMKRLLDDLLDVSRVSKGKIELRKELIDLGAVLLRAVEVSRPLMDDKGQVFTLSTAPRPVLIEADSTRLVQVFGNVLNNAAKYSERGGRIELEVSIDEGEAIVRVRDEGVGMTPDLLESAFDLFVQETRSLDRAQGGLGIGLTMVRSLVTMHGGSVRAFSDGPGRGCEIVVRLPRARGGALPALAEVPAAPARAPRPLRVLVVDDNEIAARTLADLLALLGHDVTLAPDGPAALAAFARAAPELVLIDIGLPGMDGYALAAALRVAGLAGAALVAVTGYGGDEDLRRSRAAGFDHHLVKPVDLAALGRITGSGR